MRGCVEFARVAAWWARRLKFRVFRGWPSFGILRAWVIAEGRKDRGKGRSEEEDGEDEKEKEEEETRWKREGNAPGSIIVD